MGWPNPRSRMSFHSQNAQQDKGETVFGYICEQVCFHKHCTQNSSNDFSSTKFHFPEES